MKAGRVIPVVEIAEIDVTAVFLVLIDVLSSDWTGIPVDNVHTVADHF